MASVLVIITHICFWTGKIHNTTSGRYIARLEFGVPVFFALSGFLLYRSWTTSAYLPLKPRLVSYFSHRLWRIIPAYYVMLLFVFCFNGYFVSAMGHRTTDTYFLNYLWFGQNYFPTEQIYGLTHTWSLAVEASWYLVVPLIASFIYVVDTLFSRAVAILAVVLLMNTGVILFAMQIFFTTHPWTHNYLLYPPGFLTWFIVGILIALLPAPRGWLNPLLVLILVICYLASGSGFFANTSIVDTRIHLALHKYLLYTLMAGICVQLCRGSWGKIFSIPPLVWLGEHSYEIFLFHVPFLELYMGVFHIQVFNSNPYTLGLAIMAATIPTAWIVHDSIEWLRRKIHLTSISTPKMRARFFD